MVRNVSRSAYWVGAVGKHDLKMNDFEESLNSSDRLSWILGDLNPGGEAGFKRRFFVGVTLRVRAEIS